MTIMTIAVFRKDSEEPGWTSIRLYDTLEDALKDAADGEEEEIVFELEGTEHVIGHYREPEKVPDEFKRWRVDIFVDQETWRL